MLQTVGSSWEWFVFGALVVGMMALDLAVFNRHAHKVTMREAAAWSAVWIGLALAFNAGILFLHGKTSATEFLAAFLVEKSLSVDNLFVFLAIFKFFRVEKRHQHRVLFWGVVGALVMRALLIGAGTLLLSAFDWMLYVFGAFLIYTGLKLGVARDHHGDPTKSVAMRLATRYLRTTHEMHGERFFIVREGKRLATPLFLVLVIIEFTDVLFAFDSVPAVLAISRDMFIVYTSNIFAILGLRALYFVLAGVLDRFRFLDLGLAAILVFIGLKMAGEHWVHVPTEWSLAVIAAVLTISIAASWIIPERKKTGAP
ncbi:MAG: TerC family protein [Deltaproteobacteria bacterium]|nr:TerC family protein [Deltaproteobacteria bacterium]